jgi:hypothetical protein
MRATLLGVEQRPKSALGMVANLLGNANHLWLWDYRSFARELADAGFVAIRRAQLGDHGDDAFQDIEDPDRWVNALGFECRRPT